MIGCLLDPLGCVAAGLGSVVGVVPWWWLLGGFLAGTIFGAAAGWLGVVAAVGAFLAFLGGRAGRQDKDDDPWLPLDEDKPAAPPPPRRKRPTIFDIFRK